MTALAPAPTAGTDRRPPRPSRTQGEGTRPVPWSHVVLAVLAYLPLLATRPGQVVADTKQYLYLDPAGVLAGSRSLWDPDWALGTVTHQSIGYLWPMGPWYRLFDAAGVPVWLAQRLWVGTILFAAGAGILFLGRVFGWSRRASLVAALVYVLSPYPVAYATRISALILPWAGMGWLLGLGVRSLRRGGWRDPALLGLVATTVGAVNASSLLYAGLAVVLWFPFATFVHREATPARAVAAMARIGVMVTALSSWWVVPLVVQGRYGAEVLRFSETLQVVASTSSSTEAFRGLGYWILYGEDRTGPWVSAGHQYTQSLVVLPATFALAVVSLLILFAFRWRYRAYVLTLAATGIALTIGLHPYPSPAPLAGLVGASASDSTLALALRSSARALPLYLLAVSCAVAVAYDALSRLRPRTAPLAAAALVLLAALGLPALWSGRYVGEELARDAEVPGPWREAATWLDGTDPNHRALIVPGSDFSAHRWGNTIDHVLPGLTERPVAVRELVAFSTAPAADLLIALDRRLQERVIDPDAIGPVARLLGAGSVIFQGDLEYERYRTPRPADLWSLLSAGPQGLGPPVAFGPAYPNRASERWPMQDEAALGLPPDLPDPPQVAALPVVDPLGVVRVHPRAMPLVVAGDGESLVDLAGAGLLPPDRVVLYEAALDDDQLADALAAGGEVVITDGNRMRARRWKTVRDNVGLTESVAGDGLRHDPNDARLQVFPGAPADAFTVTSQVGVQARASAYGNPISYHPEDRAASAVDGDAGTAWRVAAFSEARDEHLELTWDERVPASTVTILQPVSGHRDRTITAVALSVDGGPARLVRLDERSLTEPGQVVDLGVDEVQRLRLEIRETNAGVRPGYRGFSAVGFAEVRLGDAPPAREVVTLPRSVDRRIEDLPEENPLIVVVSRERVDPSSAVRQDPEEAIVRSVDLPAQRSFTVTGTARISGRAPDAAVDDALGLAAAPRAAASERMPGTAAGRASAVLDGDTSTAWRTPFGTATGQELTVDLGQHRSVEALSLDVLADGRHSVPTTLELRTEAGERARVQLPPVEDGPPGRVSTLDVRFAPVRGRFLTVALEAVREERTIDWYSGGPIVRPVGVAELRVPGVGANPAPVLPSSCRDDLLTVDGRAVPVRLVGDTAAATAGQDLAVEACGSPLRLGPGTVYIETTAGHHSGIDIDQLVLRSGSESSTVASPRPDIAVSAAGRDRTTVAVGAGSSPYWLVLGQSYSNGWQARIAGGASLGPPTLVDGFANGWLIDPSISGSDATVELHWAPNRIVRVAMVLSALSAVVALGLVLLPRRRRTTPSPADVPAVALGPDPAPVLPRRAALGAALTTGLVVTAATRPVIGLALGCVVLTAGWWRWTRASLAVLGVGGLAAGAAYVVVQQLRYAPPHDGAWPALWPKAHNAGWVALAALIAAGVIEVAISRRWPPLEAPDTATS